MRRVIGMPTISAGRASQARRPQARSQRALTEGERWARDQLAVLCARRFSPPAVWAFVRASRLRARATSAQRPLLARRAALWIAAGALGWLACGVCGRVGGRRIAAGLGWWALCAAMLFWHLGMVETLDGRPRNLGVADALTLARAWLVPFAWQRPSAAVCGLAALSDALDGPLARRGEPTRAGRDLEGLVDACFGLAALRGAWGGGLVARPVAVAEGLRVCAGIAFSASSYLLDAEAPDVAVIVAARPMSALRACGLVLCGARHGRLGSAALGASSLASVVCTVAALRRRASP